MEDFTGNPNVFKPAVIIEDENGVPVRTTRRSLPELTNSIKADLLGYAKEEDNMPLTNPANNMDELDRAFLKSKYC